MSRAALQVTASAHTLRKLTWNLIEAPYRGYLSYKEHFSTIILEECKLGYDQVLCLRLRSCGWWCLSAVLNLGPAVAHLSDIETPSRTLQKAVIMPDVCCMLPLGYFVPS